MSLTRTGLIGTYSFLWGIVLPFLIWFLLGNITYRLSAFVSFLLINIFYAPDKDYNETEVIGGGSFLGVIFSLGVRLSLSSTQWCILGWHLCVKTLWHFSEFFMIALVNPASLSNHSYVFFRKETDKHLCAFNLVEFIVELYFFPSMKDYKSISLVALGVCVLTDVFRKTAMFTARNSFVHKIDTPIKEDHVLVTHGVYKLFRHPSYVGLFYWGIASQLILLNPISIILQVYYDWGFLNERLIIEENMLINAFGNEYIDYKRRVWSGLPFIEGVPLPSK